MLTLADQGHDHGGFMTFPAPRIEPGGSSTFASVETEGAPQEGSQGFVVFAAGSPGTCTWSVRWNNPEAADNTTTMSLDGPEAPLYQAVDQVGQGDENVPVVFTIFGGPQQPVPPVPPPIDPVPPPPIDPIDPIDPVPPVPPPQPFEPPVQEDEPTLRLHDGVNNGMDGWVEYLQSMLIQSGADIGIDGVFGPATLAAVRRFQGEKGIQVDGTVGHQTWATLQQEAARPPSTDGRVPHTFVEQGPEARWWTEGSPFYFDDEDEFIALSTNTGNVTINAGDFTATAVVTGLDESLVLTIKDAASPGSLLFFTATGLRSRLGPGRHPVTAFMPAELGGDNVSGTIDID